MPLTINDQLVVPEAELTWRFSPSSGPGGQHANKANTRVDLTWSIVESAVVTNDQRRRLIEKLGAMATVIVDDERSQARNRDIARRRLADRVRSALIVEKPRRKTKPSKGSKERRLREKRSRSQDKKLRRPPGRDD